MRRWVNFYSIAALICLIASLILELCLPLSTQWGGSSPVGHISPLPPAWKSGNEWPHPFCYPLPLLAPLCVGPSGPFTSGGLQIYHVLRNASISDPSLHSFCPSAQIQWFWRALRSFDQADRAKFLQFVTGTSKVPLQGFAALEGMNGIQKFQIHRDDRSTDRLPSAHTW